MIVQETEAYGADVSKYQGNPVTKLRIDFKKMAQMGATFVIPKIGQYNYYDYDAEYNWKASKDAGLLRGSYWFLDYRGDGKSQAQKAFDFFSKFKDFGEGTHFVDFENGSGGEWKNVYDYITEYQRLTKCPNEKIGVYTAYYYWIENTFSASLPQREWFARYPLWLAWYLKNAPITSIQD